MEVSNPRDDRQSLGSAQHGHPLGWKLPSRTKPHIRFLYSHPKNERAINMVSRFNAGGRFRIQDLLLRSDSFPQGHPCPPWWHFRPLLNNSILFSQQELKSFITSFALYQANNVQMSCVEKTQHFAYAKTEVQISFAAD